MDKMRSRLCGVTIALTVLAGSTPAWSASGDLDPGFGSGGAVVTAIGAANDDGQDLVLQPDGKIVVAALTDSGGSYDLAVIRYDSDGALDPTFGTGGVAIAPTASPTAFYMPGVLLQPDGKIVVVGAAAGTLPGSPNFAVVRFNANGTLDGGFGAGGIVTTAVGPASSGADAIGMQSDGKLVVAGTTCFVGCDFAVVRYDAAGAVDGTFGVGGIAIAPVTSKNDVLRAMLVQPDDAIVAVGYTIDDVTFDEDFALARWTAGGTLDPTFGSGGVQTTSLSAGADAAFAVALRADGRIVAGGIASGSSAVAQYDATGGLDATFGSGGIVTVPVGSGLRGLLVEGDGGVVGAASIVQGSGTDLMLFKITPGGSLDGTFGVGGIAAPSIEPTSEYLEAVAMLPDRTLVVAGYVTATGAPGSEDVFVARVLDPLCGDGITSNGEDCDAGPENGTAGQCCSATCAFRPAGAACRPAAGACDVAETCTGTSPACPADALVSSGTVCRASSYPCDVAEACDGVAPACPADGHLADGSPCDDGTACTLGDQCTGGVCFGATGIVCGPCERCDAAVGCIVSPVPACNTPLEAGGASFAAKSGDASARRLAWKWRKGLGASFGSFGDPTTITGYRLCVYDQSAPTTTLLLTATPHVGGTCGSTPCWRSRGTPPTRWRYVDRDLGADGVKTVDLKAGSSARVKVGLKAQGALLPLPTFGSLPTPLTVQLWSSDGACFGATFSASGVRANAGGTFKARSD